MRILLPALPERLANLLEVVGNGGRGVGRLAQIERVVDDGPDRAVLAVVGKLFVLGDRALLEGLVNRVLDVVGEAGRVDHGLEDRVSVARVARVVEAGTNLGLESREVERNGLVVDDLGLALGGR